MSDESLDDHMVTIRLGVNQAKYLLRFLELLKLQFMCDEYAGFRNDIDRLRDNIESQIDLYE